VTPVRALVFDLDGTLVDSRADIAAALNAVLSRPLAPSEILPMIGDGSRALVERGLARTGAPVGDADVDAALAAFTRAYARAPTRRTTLLPGAREALALGLPQSLVTNKPRVVTDLVLSSLGIASSFVAIYGGGDGPLKPSPAGVLAVVRAMGVAPSDAWVIGDGPQDIAAGRAAGAFTVALRAPESIADGARVLAEKPDLVVASLAALVRAVTEARA
jgi:HAD superfamily hydrolase (TIGR01509 family)